jgi:signal transduction histidine kinase
MDLRGRSGAYIWRVLVATTLCVIVGFCSARLVRREVSRAMVERFSEPQLRYLYDQYERVRCEAAPERWTLTYASDATTYAYDGDTLVSRNPAAPVLDRRVLASVAPGRHVAIDVRGWTLASGGIVVFRGADHGPCAIMQTTWSEQDSGGARLTRWLPLGVVFAAALAAGLGFVLLVPPVQLLERRRAALQRHLADVAHDLKTPISSLQLALEHALADDRAVSAQGLMTQALGDVMYLGALTSNLRMAAEIREGWKPSQTTVDLRDVVERVAMRVRMFARHRDIALESAVPDAGVPVQCDPVAAEQALSNIVENAITHGESGQHVAVVLDRSGGDFTLSVIDDGPGVPPTALPHLGERTFRSDTARQRDPRGSGLGLAIAAAVCKRSSWQLAFAREQPRGLRVTIRGACTGG